MVSQSEEQFEHFVLTLPLGVNKSEMLSWRVFYQDVRREAISHSQVPETKKRNYSRQNIE